MQREKEDAHDYRYFPDPDLVPVVVDDAWRESIKARVPELPMARFGRYVKDYTLGVKDQTIFPEIELDKIKRNIGFDVTICTTAKTDSEAKSLLTELGMPFSDKKRTAAPAPAAA